MGRGTGVKRKDLRYVQRYLTWLKEDKELARQVADAWNAIVERGEADVVQSGGTEYNPGYYSGESSDEETSDGE